MYLADQASLEAFVERVAGAEVLAIDTEFLRETTYYPKLCLLQMATDDEVAIIDPLSVDDLSVIAPLLEDERTMKLFHAGGQDIEILLREVGSMPCPLFDTQVAAALLGHTQQIGYGALVHAVCGVTLNKTDSYTDWSQRPLSDSQIDYAADDVIYLPRVYRKMRSELESKGRLGWLAPDFEEMMNPAKYSEDPRLRYRRLKRVTQLDERQLCAAREFAAWREEEARKRDMPRKWLVSDEQIVEACRRDARTIDDLYMVRGVREKLPVRDARAVIERMNKARSLPKSEWPNLGKPSRNERNVDASIDLMAALVRLRAKENGVAMQTLASHSDLAALARGHSEDSDLMRGWRWTLVGEELVDLLEGRIALSLSKGELVVERLG